MAAPLLLIGASGHAHALLALLQRHGGFQPVGLIDSYQPVGTSAHGLTILGGEADLPALCALYRLRHLLVAIGDNFQRQAMSERIRQQLPNIIFPTLIDPSAVVAADSQIGRGAVVMALAHVGAGCQLGEGCLLNTHSSLDHDSSLGAYASLAPGAVSGGRVQIGDRSAIGLGANIIQQIHIGSDCVVGAGSLVLQSIPSAKLAYGSPASLIRSREPDEPYL